jgi:hypothetical protein
MPANALMYHDVDAIFRLSQSGPLLGKLVAGVSVEEAMAAA